MKLGYFTDDKGKPSSMRVGFMYLVVVGSLIIALGTLFDKDIYGGLTLVGYGITLKGYQKHQEVKNKKDEKDTSK